jgi:tRNA (cytidine/uridine-2'-O-)-methyltransferase
MLHVVLFQPQIPQNTGNIGRMCAVTRARLHLVHPLGFEVTDKNLKRAGMDYWHSLDVHHHADWPAFKASAAAPRRLWLFTTHASRTFWDVAYELTDPQRVKIPHANGELRSLNLSTAAGIATYEALRQVGLSQPA